jgi:hypothetical protein
LREYFILLTCNTFVDILFKWMSINWGQHNIFLHMEHYYIKTAHINTYNINRTWCAYRYVDYYTTNMTNSKLNITKITFYAKLTPMESLRGWTWGVFLRRFNVVIIGYLRQLQSDKNKLDHGTITVYLYGSPNRGGISK